MIPLPHLLRRMLSGLLLLIACAAAAAQPMLRLSTARADIDAWPAVTMLSDPEAKLALKDVLAARGRFVEPTGPHANLGPRRDVVWLHLWVLPDAADDGRWVLDIDYPSLDQIDVWLVSSEQVRQHALLGDHRVFVERPLATRSHATRLSLEPGKPQELLVRVQTTGTMIVPLRLAKADAFHAREAAAQLLQGMAAGIGLCMVLYALAHGWGVREPIFIYFAATVASTTLFFFAYYGLAPQYLWPTHRWLTENMAPLAVLLSLGFGMLMVERMLDIRSVNRNLGRATQVVSALALTVALLFVLRLVDYRGALLASSVLGPMPLLLALPVSWARWRQGDRVAAYLFVGWMVYSAGVAVMEPLLRGWIDSNWWTQHAYLAASIFDELMWLRVLGVRHEQAQRAAEGAAREREMLNRMAHTDTLTSLPNRLGLEAELAVALAAASPSQQLAVYLVDLDGFKAVNDQLGHEAGDELLAAVAQRLKAQLRQHDVVARLGGDEFVVLVRDLNDEAPALAIGQKLVDAFREPFMLGDRIAHVGLTVGCAIAPQDGHGGTELLRLADAAMYRGKKGGRGTLRRAQASADR